MSDRDDRTGANALHDAAVPNALVGPVTHVAPARNLIETVLGAERVDQDESDDGGLRDDVQDAASRLRALALTYVGHSEAIEARLLEGFQRAASQVAAQCGDIPLRNTEDSRLSFGADGWFAMEVRTPDGPTSWLRLGSALEIVNACDPVDLFDDLAGQLEQRFPAIASVDKESATRRLRYLAGVFATPAGLGRPSNAGREVDLIEQFEQFAEPFAREVGDITLLDGADEHVEFGRDGRFMAKVVPESDESNWVALTDPEAISEYYSPEDLFQALGKKLDRANGPGEGDTREVAATILHDLASLWARRAEDAETRVFEAFNRASSGLEPSIGEFVIVDDEDERLVIDTDGRLRARILDRTRGAWRDLNSPADLVASYDPTDVFADLADALDDAFPGLGDMASSDDQPEWPPGKER